MAFSMSAMKGVRSWSWLCRFSVAAMAKLMTVGLAGFASSFDAPQAARMNRQASRAERRAMVIETPPKSGVGHALAPLMRHLRDAFDLKSPLEAKGLGR